MAKKRKRLLVVADKQDFELFKQEEAVFTNIIYDEDYGKINPNEDNSLVIIKAEIEYPEDPGYMLPERESITLDELKAQEKRMEFFVEARKEIRKSIMKFVNREYEENYSENDFSKIFPDEKHIQLAYTTTPDGKHEIQFEMNLKDFIYSQFVDDKLVSYFPYLEKIPDYELALETIIQEIDDAFFDYFVTVGETDLRDSLGWEIDDEGNFYDPKEKGL